MNKRQLTLVGSKKMQQLAQRYKLVIQYRGTNFIGWQKQSLEATSEKRSVQGLLEVWP